MFTQTEGGKLRIRNKPRQHKWMFTQTEGGKLRIRNKPRQH